MKFEPTEHKRNKVFIYWVDVSGTCNLKCPSCATGNYIDSDFTAGRNPTGFMDLALYQKILTKIKADNVSDRIEIHLYTWGEPLLHPKIAKFVDMTKKMGFACGLSSNLNIEKNLKEIVKSGPDYFRISLSGFYQKNYKETHRGGDIRQVKSNMYRLRHLMDQYKSKIAVQVLYHVYKHNAGDDLLMMVKLCEELKFSLDPVWAFFTPFEKNIDYLNGKISNEDRKVIDTLAIDPRKVSEAALPYRDQDCNLRKTQMTLNVDGSVQLCCATFDKAHVVANSFLDKPHKELQKLRYENDMCRICMNKGQHVYLTYQVGDKMDELGEESLKKNNSKFIFKQSSQPKLVLRNGNLDEAIELPRAPQIKQNRGFRKVKNTILGRN